MLMCVDCGKKPRRIGCDLCHGCKTLDYRLRGVAHIAGRKEDEVWRVWLQEMCDEMPRLPLLSVHTRLALREAAVSNLEKGSGKVAVVFASESTPDLASKEESLSPVTLLALQNSLRSGLGFSVDTKPSPAGKSPVEILVSEPKRKVIRPLRGEVDR